MIRNILIISILIILYGCKDQYTKELDHINILCESNPSLAMSELDKLAAHTMTEKNRHRYALLTIKSHDKAYVCHTSDSLILDVLEWYGKHKDSPFYPEALYYGGRVYSDMGDYPTALGYYQQALDKYPDDNKNALMRSRVLSQMGRLLETLSMRSQAIPYLEESINIMQRYPNKDYELAYEYALLGLCYLYLDKSSEALNNMTKAINYSKSLPLSDQANIKVELADIFLTENKIDSALGLIRGLPEEVDSDYLYFTLAKAARIYRKANINDTAYTYANRLIRCGIPGYAKTGFQVIFSLEDINLFPKDSIVSLITEYKNTIEEYLDRYEAESVMLQNSAYNYQVHVRERENSERDRQHLYIGLIMLVAVVAIMMAVVWYLRARNMALLVKFHNSMELIKRLKEESTQCKDSVEKTFVEESGLLQNDAAVSLKTKKEKMLGEIQSILDNDSHGIVSLDIFHSDIYHQLTKKLKEGKGITENEELWSKIEETIESASPGFKYRLQILTEGKLTAAELKVALMIKCGFSPTQTAILINRTKNTVSSQRVSIARKILGANASSKMIDAIIIST